MSGAISLAQNRNIIQSLSEKYPTIGKCIEDNQEDNQEALPKFLK